MLQRARALIGLVRSRAVDVEGVHLVIPPGVLDPILFRSGAWFARQVAQQVQPGMRLLDLGTGSGVVGLLARRAGASVVAVDLSARAVQAARDNGLPDVRQGDLFEPVAGERFDLVAFNPPYLRGQVRGRLGRERSLSMALHGGDDWDTVRRFGSQVADHLVPGGRALVCWSDRAGQAPRRLLGSQWEQQASVMVEAELLSLWDRQAAGQAQPPEPARGR